MRVQFAAVAQPVHLLGGNIVEPYPDFRGTQYQGQPLVVLINEAGNLLFLDAEHDDIVEHEEGKERHGPHGIGHPSGDAGVNTLGIEPLVLDGLHAVSRTEAGIGTVEPMEQHRVVRHEPVLSVGYVQRRYLQILRLKLLHQPLQRQRVPHNQPVLLGTHFLDGLLHVAIGQAVGLVALVYHHAVAQAAGVDDDLMGLQVIQRTNLQGLRLGTDHTMGEQLHHLLTVATVVFVERMGQAQHQVRPSGLHILQGLRGRFQLDDIGNLQVFKQLLQHVDIESFRLAMLIQEDIRPKIPRIFIDERILLRILPASLDLAYGITRRDSDQHDGQKHPQKASFHIIHQVCSQN